MPQSSSEIVLHVWPARWNLASFDPLCLATVMYLQHAIPGKFSISECSNPDLSPTGQLPFLIHEHNTVSTFGSIIKYIAELKNIGVNANLEASLDHTERSQMTAWIAHVESNMGDLVYHAMYSDQATWEGLTHPTLVSMLPVPQRYYVPGRVRESYRPRLEAAGLWNLHTLDKEEKKPFRDTPKPEQREKNKKIFLQAFGREKVLNAAKTTLDIYTRLLGDKDFFYRDRPTALDFIVASHMILLLEPKYPDSCLQHLVSSSYAELRHHSRQVYAKIFESMDTSLRMSSPQIFKWRSLVPLFPSNRKKVEATYSEEDAQYTKMRWTFLGLALGGLSTYLVVVWGSLLATAQARMLAEHQHEKEAEGAQEE